MNTYWIACRELWREADFQIRLRGGKGGKEPSFRPCDKKESREDARSILASWSRNQLRK